MSGVRQGKWPSLARETTSLHSSLTHTSMLRFLYVSTHTSIVSSEKARQSRTYCSSDTGLPLYFSRRSLTHQPSRRTRS